MSAETAPNYRLQSRILAQLLDHFLQSISQEWLIATDRMCILLINSHW